MRLRCLTRIAIAIFLLLNATLGHAQLAVQSVHAQPPMVLQPPTKRQVYVFFDQFLDIKNSTPPSRVLALLDQVNSYYANSTNGAWSFNWTLFYPALGRSWYTVNETYAQAGNNSDLTPLFKVIDQAYNSGAQFPVLPLCCVPIADEIMTIIFFAGNSSAITHKIGHDIWPVTSGPHCIGPTANPYCFLGSVVAESDPIGILMYEMTHQLQQFNMYGKPTSVGFPDPVGAVPSGMIIPDPWDLMWGGIYNGNPTGTRPTEYSAFTRISLGFLPLSQVAVIDRGQTSAIVLNDLEEPTIGYQAIRIPISNDTSYDWFYMAELRRGISSDYYFPWITSLFPDRVGLLIWYVRSSRSGGDINAFLVKAHSWDNAGQTAIFGPESNPKYTAMRMYDSTHNINLTIVSTSNSSFLVQVSNGGYNSLVCTNPSITCFLGILNLGEFGPILNAIVAFGATLAVVALTTRRRRKYKEHLAPTPLSQPNNL